MCHYEACGILQQSCKPCTVLALHTLEQKASQLGGHDLVEPYSSPATTVEWTTVGGLIGRGGAGTKEVQMLTGTKIGIREIPDDPDNRSLNIAPRLKKTR
eukprot:s4942_g2.t1